MPTISQFFGIVIRMYFDDHPPAHLHAFHSGREVQVALENLEILEGSLSPRALGLLREWAALHKGELQANWRRAMGHEPLVPIAPLE